MTIYSMRQLVEMDYFFCALIAVVFCVLSLFFVNKCLSLSYSDNSKPIYIVTSMLLADKIKQLREEKQLFQRQLAEALEIDTPMYCKIERGSRPIKRTQVVALARFLSTDEKELLSLWLADKVLEVLNTEKKIAREVLKIANENINK
mgnify:CR=1 FL=1